MSDYMATHPYSGVYCDSCGQYTKPGLKVFRPGASGSKKARPSYTLSFGVCSILCLDPILDDISIDDIELEVSHPFWGWATGDGSDLQSEADYCYRTPPICTISIIRLLHIYCRRNLR